MVGLDRRTFKTPLIVCDFVGIVPLQYIYDDSHNWVFIVLTNLFSSIGFFYEIVEKEKFSIPEIFE